jgi:hypothetical protein
MGRMRCRRLPFFFTRPRVPCDGARRVSHLDEVVPRAMGRDMFGALLVFWVETRTVYGLGHAMRILVFAPPRR